MPLSREARGLQNFHIMITLESILNNCTDEELDKLLSASCTVTETLLLNSGMDSTHLMIESQTYFYANLVQISAFDEIRNREKGLKEHKYNH